MENKYYVYGAYQNANKPGMINYMESLLRECDTVEEAYFYARNYRGAWDAVIIRDQEENEVYRHETRRQRRAWYGTRCE